MDASTAIFVGLIALLVVLSLVVCGMWIMYFRSKKHGERILKIEQDTPRSKVRKLHEIGTTKKPNGTNG